MDHLLHARHVPTQEDSNGEEAATPGRRQKMRMMRYLGLGKVRGHLSYVIGTCLHPFFKTLILWQWVPIPFSSPSLSMKTRHVVLEEQATFQKVACLDLYLPHYSFSALSSSKSSHLYCLSLRKESKLHAGQDLGPCFSPVLPTPRSVTDQ